MSVYVDMIRAGRVGRINSRWSHLYADTHAELETFARQLGLRPAGSSTPPPTASTTTSQPANEPRPSSSAPIQSDTSATSPS